MGLTAHRRRHAQERANPPPKRPPNTITWEAHQSALVDAVRGYQLEILDLKKGSAGGDGELAAQLDEATALLSKAASENEALCAQIRELESLLDEAAKAESADDKPVAKPLNEKSPKPSGKGDSKAKGK